MNPEKICSDEEGGGSMSPSREGGGGEISGGILARERGNTAHIPGEQLRIEIGGRSKVFYPLKTIPLDGGLR